MFNLAQISAPISPAFYAFLGGAGLALLTKVGVLVWAYVKTRKLAALVYGLYVFAQAVLPIALTRFMQPSQYAVYAGGTWLLEIVLFVWLIFSLSKKVRKASAPVEDA